MTSAAIRVQGNIGRQPGPWAQDGACRPEPGHRSAEHTAKFYPNHRHADRSLYAICATCPVQADCLEHAIQHEHFGWWAGTSERDRQRLRRIRRRLVDRGAA